MFKAYRVYGTNIVTGKFGIYGEADTVEQAERMQNEAERGTWRDTEIEFNPAREPAPIQFPR